MRERIAGRPVGPAAWIAAAVTTWLALAAGPRPLAAQDAAADLAPEPAPGGAAPVGGTASTAGTDGIGDACSDAEYRGFDFWIGRWRVESPDGRLAGRNTVTRLADGCGLGESWEGARGTTGSSLNFYDGSSDRWHQLWVGGHGEVLRLSGGWTGSAMVLVTDDPGPADARDRITWEPLPEGRVRQVWERSRDAGRTWETVFDGTYVPIEGPNGWRGLGGGAYR